MILTYFRNYPQETTRKLKEMNNKMLTDDVLSTKNLNIQKENDFLLIKKISTVKTNSKIKESAFKYVKVLKEEGEFYENNLFSALESKEFIARDVFQINKNKLPETEKRIVLKSSDNLTTDIEKDKESKSKLVNSHSVEALPLIDNKIDSPQLICKKEFRKVEHLPEQECKNKGTNCNPEEYKCKFCSLIFTSQHLLNNHIESHNRYKCTVCASQFTSHKALCQHLKLEHNIINAKKLFHCSFCEESFSKKQLLNIHLKSHLGDQHLCLKCGFVCDNENIYKDHIETHNKTANYECELCGQKFIQSQQHKNHLLNHEKYSCAVCNIAFSNKKQLSQHNKSIHNDKTKKIHECSVCKKSFHRPAYLAVHQKIHTGENSIKCSVCEMSFHNKTTLSKHQRSIKHLKRLNNNEGKNIEMEKKHSCPKCSAKFYVFRSLSRHLKYSHSDSELLKCPHCDYHSKILANMKRHIETHTDIKHFTCKICKSSFRTAATLKQHHVFVHSENREFLCDICNKGFKDKSTLQRHMRSHSENRPYKCYCNKDYKRLSHLKRHMSSAHDITFRSRQFQVIKENMILNTNSSIKNLVEMPETFSDHSSSDIFSESSVDDRLMINNNAVTIEVKKSDINGNVDDTKPSNSDKKNGNNIEINNVSLNILPATPINQSFTDNNFKNIACDSISLCNTTPILLPISQSSFSFNDTNLTLSPSSFCNFSLPSTSDPSVVSREMLSLSSTSEAYNRPHSLPNLNIMAQIPNVDIFTNLSRKNSDASCLRGTPSFLLTSNILSRSQEGSQNLFLNNDTKQSFSDSNITSLTSQPQKNTGNVNNSLDKNLEQNNSSKEFLNDSACLSLSPSFPSNVLRASSLESNLEESNCSEELYNDPNFQSSPLSPPCNVFQDRNSLDINIEQHNSLEKPSSDSDFQSLPPSFLDSFFSSELGIPNEDSCNLKLHDSDFITTDNNNFSNTSNENNYLSHNLFPNDSLIDSLFDETRFNSEFEAFSNLC